MYRNVLTTKTCIEMTHNGSLEVNMSQFRFDSMNPKSEGRSQLH